MVSAPRWPTRRSSSLSVNGLLISSQERVGAAGPRERQDDDVEGRDAGPDGAVASSSPQDLFKRVVHLGSESDGVLVEGYRAAVHRQHELGTVFNGLAKI